MVDFPEGYGFEPGGAKMLAQSEFYIEIGTYTWRGASAKRTYRRTSSPWQFNAIGYIANDRPAGSRLMGRLFGAEAPIEGSLQQVVTALCTIHRMKGHMK